MAKYNKQNCTSNVKAIIQFGNETITLVGTHAFNWSIVRETSNKIVITSFPNRLDAKKEFKRFSK